MRLLSVTLLVVGSLVSTGVVVEAQGLAEAAAREKEKRRSQKPIKVFTEEDLRRAGHSGRASVIGGDVAAADAQTAQGEGSTPAEGTSAEGSSTEGGAKPGQKSPAELRADKQKEWRARLDKAQADLSAATAEITRVQGFMQGLTPESTPAVRAGFTASLQEAQSRQAAAKKQIEDLEQEGRFGGFR